MFIHLSVLSTPIDHSKLSKQVNESGYKKHPVFKKYTEITVNIDKSEKHKNMNFWE